MMMATKASFPIYYLYNLEFRNRYMEPYFEEYYAILSYPPINSRLATEFIIAGILMAITILLR